MGWSQQNANEFPDVFTTRTIQPVDSISAFEQGHLDLWRYINAFIIIIMTHLAFNNLMATGTKLYSEMFYILYNGISFEMEVHGRT